MRNDYHIQVLHHFVRHNVTFLIVGREELPLPGLSRLAVAQVCAVKGAPLGGRAQLALDRAARRRGNGYAVSAEVRGARNLSERESNSVRQRSLRYQALLVVMPLARRATSNRMTAPMTALMTSGTKPAPI